jgi:multimeric flavodoxin WrbA
MLASDLVVLTSPVYGLDVAAPMKALIDHLCFMWMSHRPDPAMFDKLGLVISTTAGMGAGRTAKTMRLSLRYWGVKKSFSFAKAVAALRWEDIPENKRTGIEKSAEVLAARIAAAAGDIRKVRKPLFRSFLFRMMAGMQKSNNWNPADRSHWERQGWLAGGKPF